MADQAVQYLVQVSEGLMIIITITEKILHEKIYTNQMYRVINDQVRLS